MSNDWQKTTTYFYCLKVAFLQFASDLAFFNIKIVATYSVNCLGGVMVAMELHLKSVWDCFSFRFMGRQIVTAKDTSES